MGGGTLAKRESGVNLGGPAPVIELIDVKFEPISPLTPRLR